MMVQENRSEVFGGLPSCSLSWSIIHRQRREQVQAQLRCGLGNNVLAPASELELNRNIGMWWRSSIHCLS